MATGTRALVREVEMLTAQKRRSDRLMMTIPLRVEGIDAQGASFDAPGNTVDVSQHGARVRIPRALASGQRVRLHNPLNKAAADFRIVAVISSSLENSADYGVECLHAEGNIWEIHFPPPAENGPSDAKALLECRLCHTVALADMTMGELELLWMAGIVAKDCPTCQATTPARYAVVRPANSGPAETSWKATLAKLGQPRSHRRVCLQAPLGIRDSQGGVQVTRTENVSQGGFCFTSEKDYLAGQQVMVVFPGNTSSRKMEIPGQIVWQRALEKSRRKVYGLHCERPGG